MNMRNRACGTHGHGRSHGLQEPQGDCRARHGRPQLADKAVKACAALPRRAAERSSPTMACRSLANRARRALCANNDVPGRPAHASTTKRRLCTGFEDLTGERMAETLLGGSRHLLCLRRALQARGGQRRQVQNSQANWAAPSTSPLPPLAPTAASPTSKRSPMPTPSATIMAWTPSPRGQPLPGLWSATRTASSHCRRDRWPRAAHGRRRRHAGRAGGARLPHAASWATCWPKALPRAAKRLGPAAQARADHRQGQRRPRRTCPRSSAAWG
jgi:hypothetical protein